MGSQFPAASKIESTDLHNVVIFMFIDSALMMNYVLPCSGIYRDSMEATETQRSEEKGNFDRKAILLK